MAPPLLAHGRHNRRETQRDGSRTRHNGRHAENTGSHNEKKRGRRGRAAAAGAWVAEDVEWAGPVHQLPAHTTPQNVCTGREQLFSCERHDTGAGAGAAAAGAERAAAGAGAGAAPDASGVVVIFLACLWPDAPSPALRLCFGTKVPSSLATASDLDLQYAILKDFP